jgi:hypothetical protein
MTNSLLDLETNYRASSWRFDLYDGSEPLGTLELMDRDSPPSITVDISRSIKRTMQNFSVLPNEIDEINAVRWSVRVFMILSDKTEWPLGLFRFADVSRHRITAMNGVELTVGECGLVDQLLIVDQELDHSVSYPPGTVITDAIYGLLSEIPIEFNMQTSPAVITPQAEALSWKIGTSRLRVINELAMMIGFHDLYFDNVGVGQLGPMPDPFTAAAGDVLSYPAGLRTFRGTVTRSTNILELPNRFIVINNGATDLPVYGICDIPPEAPHSIENRGFVVSHVEQMQGIATQQDADFAARSLCRGWRFPFETVEFSGPPDPRHDHFNVVDFEGDRFLEMTWTMECVDGSNMQHTIRRTYDRDMEHL